MSVLVASPQQPLHDGALSQAAPPALGCLTPLRRSADCMPDIGFYHPLIVHFAIALSIVGVLLRWISFTGAAKFAGPAAAALLLLGTGAAVVAARSGGDASVDV